MNDSLRLGGWIETPPASMIRLALSAQLVILERLPDTSPAIRAVCALLFIAVIIPHGAIDWSVAKRLLPNLGAPRFFTFYGASMALMAVLWWFSPSASLVLFLALSVYHFGVSDTTELPDRGFTLPRAAHGLLVVALMTGAAPLTLSSVLTVLGIVVNASTVAGAAQLIVVATYVSLGVQASRSNKVRRLFADDSVLIVLFVVASPLLAITTYLALWHSWTHLSNMCRAVGRGSNLLREATPYTLIPTVVLAVALSQTNIATPNILAVAIVGLSVLTVPHALLVSRFLRVSGAAYDSRTI